MCCKVYRRAVEEKHLREECGTKYCRVCDTRVRVPHAFCRIQPYVPSWDLPPGPGDTDRDDGEEGEEEGHEQKESKELPDLFFFDVESDIS